jgi:hypothetical protein
MMKQYLYKPKHLKKVNKQLKDSNENKSFLSKMIKSLNISLNFKKSFK